jgi:hypothetical protein
MRTTRFLSALLAVAAAALAQPVPYDVVYVRQPRFGDNTNTIWPEVFHPARLDPGADLMLLHPDGREEVLVAGGNGGVTDPFVSFDAQWVYYSLFPDLRTSALNPQRGDLPYAGADIWRIHLGTRQTERLTRQEFTPNTGAGRWDESNPVNPPSQFNRLGYGILNLGPCPLPGGRIVFTSNRNGFVPTKGYTNPALQLFVMDADGSNVTPIAPMTLGSALHPTVLRDGRIMFSSFESQGLRDQRVWGLWHIQPDGRNWGPLVSAFHSGQAFHFMTQLSNEDLVVEDYYNLNNNGFGAYYRMPARPPGGGPAFHPAALSQNPSIERTIGSGLIYPFRFSFTPRGFRAITPFTHPDDEAAPAGTGGGRVGKLTHPSGAPGGDLLTAWSPGPCNDLTRPTPLPYYDSGIYLMRGAGPIWSPSDLVRLKNDPAYNEAWPRAVVSYQAVHGVPEPATLPWLPNDGSVHRELPAGTPYGLVGTSSLYKRESFPGAVTRDRFNGLDAFNTSENGQSSNWELQGGDAGRYANSDIWAIRIVAMEPNTHRSYGPNLGQHYRNAANEHMRILGEVPVRKTGAGGQPVLDPEGNPDTSFLVKIPADLPFTFQTLDRDGLVLNMAQTWHQVRPGEMRADCGGCHAHSQAPLAFESTAAARPGYRVWDLTKTTPLLTRDKTGAPAVRTVPRIVVDVEFHRDVRPILERSCVPCHRAGASPPGQLVLDDRASYGGVPGDYARLAEDGAARWGHPPVIVNRQWRQTNASRYVRPFQSRRSLLVWKVFGRRLDGWTNADHPTETVPGDPLTLPAGALADDADLDFTGTIMPPPGSKVPPLSQDEKMTIARWVDLGCPIDLGWGNANARFGWFLDDLRPVLTVSAPRPGPNPGPLDELRIGVADATTGLDPDSLSIQADIAIAGRAAGAELASLARPEADGVWVVKLRPALTSVPVATLRVSVKDKQGNVTRVAQKFSVQ